MTYAEVLTELAGNLGIGLSDLILLLTLMGGIIFFARNFKIGAICLTVLLASEVIIFALLGWDTTNVLILLFVAIITMALSLYSTGAQIN